MRRRRRWVVTPDLVHEPLHGNDLARSQEEHGQHGALLGASQREALVPEPYLERAEDAELHVVLRHIGSKPLPGRL